MTAWTAQHNTRSGSTALEPDHDQVHAHDHTATSHRTEDRRTGARLLLIFVVLGLVVAVCSGGGTLARAITGIALLLGAITLPHGLWQGHPRHADTEMAGRLCAVALLALAWAATLGGSAIGWLGTAPLAPALFAWVAALARETVPLLRMRVFAAVTVAVSALLALGTLAGVGGAGATATPLSAQLIAGAAAPGFLPGLALGLAAMGAASLLELGRTAVRVRGTAAMRSLAASFGGLTLWSLAGIIIVSTSALPTGGGPQQTWQFGAATLTVLSCVGAILLGLGLNLARRSPLSHLGALPLAGSVVGFTAASWFGFTTQGLSALPALALLTACASFAALTGISLVTATVRRAAGARTRTTARAARTEHAHLDHPHTADAPVSGISHAAHAGT